jgi:hypothetical protein
LISVNPEIILISNSRNHFDFSNARNHFDFSNFSINSKKKYILMGENEMLYCLIAFILGYLVARQMGNGFSVSAAATACPGGIPIIPAGVCGGAWCNTDTEAHCCGECYGKHNSKCVPECDPYGGGPHQSGAPGTSCKQGYRFDSGICIQN